MQGQPDKRSYLAAFPYENLLVVSEACGWILDPDEAERAERLEQAQRVRHRKLQLLLVGQFHSREIEREFREAAARFCGLAKVHFLDGSDGSVVRSAWRASDIFVSLSDNIQETFGPHPYRGDGGGLALRRERLEWLQGHRDRR